MDLLMPVANISARLSLRALHCGDLNVPRTIGHVDVVATKSNRAFSVAAPQAWNRLPMELKQL